MIDMGKILLFDGAMGTMLQRRGLKLGAVPEALNLTAPEEITAIHKEYLEERTSFCRTPSARTGSSTPRAASSSSRIS